MLYYIKTPKTSQTKKLKLVLFVVVLILNGSVSLASPAGLGAVEITPLQAETSDDIQAEILSRPILMDYSQKQLNDKSYEDVDNRNGGWGFNDLLESDTLLQNNNDEFPPDYPVANFGRNEMQQIPRFVKKDLIPDYSKGLIKDKKSPNTINHFLRDRKGQKTMLHFLRDRKAVPNQLSHFLRDRKTYKTQNHFLRDRRSINVDMLRQVLGYRTKKELSHLLRDR